ncbi:MAG: glycerol acyltransferase [Synechococcales cyanobacterium]
MVNLTVQPALQFIEPRLDPLTLSVVQTGLPWWLKWTKGISRIDLERGQILVEQIALFQQHKTRLLLAFRHPSTADPPCLIHTLGSLVPRLGKTLGIGIHTPVHAHFMYDRGIPLWAGQSAAWLLPRLGATPIRRGRLDRQGLKSARSLLLEGRFPLAAAPEGGANGHSDILNPLEPGMAQLGFWCQEDLLKAQRSEQVIILPIHMQYTYVGNPRPAMERLLAQLERDCGLTPHPRHPVAQRLTRLGEHLLPMMEAFYERYFPKPLTHALKTEDLGIPERLARLLDIALRIAEFNLNIEPQGSLTDRRHRIEQAAWDRIYCLDEEQPPHAAAQGLADRIAQEAHLHLWHMRLVETFIAMTSPPTLDLSADMGEHPDFLAESLLRYWALMTRLQGGDPLRQSAPILATRRATVVIGDPLSVSDRWPDYQHQRRRAIDDLTQTLHTSLAQLMQQYSQNRATPL